MIDGSVSVATNRSFQVENEELRNGEKIKLLQYVAS